VGGGRRRDQRLARRLRPHVPKDDPELHRSPVRAPPCSVNGLRFLFLRGEAGAASASAAAAGAAPPRPSRAPRAARGVRARRPSAPERERRAAPAAAPRRDRAPPPSIQLLADRRQRRARVRIPRLDRERALELARRLREQPLRPVDLPQVAVRVVAWLVARRLDRRLEPGNRLVETPELDQVRADVVVRIPEVGIDRDRLLALRDRVLKPPLEAVGPAEEGVRLGGGVERDRLLVALDGGVQLALHLQAVGLLEELDRLLEALLLGHRPQ